MSQCLHSFRQFIREHPEVENNWFNISNYICILNVKNEFELNEIVEKCIEYNINFSLFKEPDYNNSITSITLEPGMKSKKITSHLPLALKAL
jgi:hypothetical protein